MNDLISRADAVACLSHGEGCGHSCRNRINALPSAVCDDCIWHVCNYNEVDWDAPSADRPITSGYIADDKEVPPYTTTSAVSAEPIRCKDCKHYEFADNRAFGMPVKYCDWFGFEDVDDNDFCSRAERREP